MLSLLTSDDWSTATIDVWHGLTTATFTPSAGVSSAYQWAVNIVTQLNASVFAAAGWKWRWVRDAVTGGAFVQLGVDVPPLTGLYEIDASAAAQTMVGLYSVSFFTTWAVGYSSTVASGTWAPKQGDGRLSVARNYRHLAGNGDAGGAGAIRPGVPGSALKKPAVDALCTAAEAARLTALLANAPNPREGYVWQEHTATWLKLAIGPVKAEAQGHTLQRVTIDAAEVA